MAGDLNALPVMLARRLGSGVLTLLFVASAIFLATELLPGDAATAILGQDATAEGLAALRERLGLDRAPHVRYFEWLWHLLSGDLGISYGTKSPVAALVADRLWNTLRLAAFAATLSLPAAFLLGVSSAMRAGTAFDRGLSAIALTIISVPEFFVGLGLVFVFAVHAGMFPALAIVRPGQDTAAFLRATFLPALTLALAIAPHVIRMTRSNVIRGLASPFVEMAVLKGIPRRTIVWRHVLPNVVGPLINVAALVLAYFIAGVVVVETVFAFPGIGRLMVDAVATKDAPLVQACALVLSSIYVGVNTMADIAATIANPRLRNSR